MSHREDDEKAFDYGDDIDQATFEQILEMDDDETDREFSRSIVFGFFEQAEETFKKMDAALEKKKRGSAELRDLSGLGHFLKGSSATLGLTKVQRGCEKIQHYGEYKSDDGESAATGDDEEQFGKIEVVLKQVRKDYLSAEKRMKAFFD